LGASPTKRSEAKVEDAPDLTRDWVPNPGPQTRFLATTAEEVLYGGAAGGGKSAAIIAAPLRWVHVPEFRALILRRTTPQLTNLLDKAKALYDRVFPDAGFNWNKLTWTFPSGATIRFNHCEHERDAKIYDGDEFQYLACDELTHFSENQYRAIRARIRSSAPGLPRYTRSTTNPGGPGHEWVFKRWGPWLNPEYDGLPPRYNERGQRVPPANPGERLWYVIGEGGCDVWVPKGSRDERGNLAKSRTFIPAKLADNPKLLENDPGYAATLRDLDPVRSAQLLDGNWLVRPARGMYFKRVYFAGRFLDAVPANVVARVRYWDRAASVDGDWTVGLRLAALDDGRFVIEHVVRLRGEPYEVEKAIRATAEADGLTVTQCLEQDPGAAGKSEVAYLIRALAGFSVRAFPKRKDKVTSVGPVSAQCAAGNVFMVRGPWNEVLLGELEEFPEGAHDDQADTLAGAFNVLMGVADDDGGALVGRGSRR
jgi:predicted phage terminase large subunit-like protein